MKPGFTLLEIILATALAAMISVALIFMLQQMNGTLTRVDNISGLHMRAALLQNQMERDIMGAFAPADFSVTSTTSETPQEGPKKIEKIFWGDNTLEMLTFITNNPLPVYWGKRSGKPQPKIVRVMYRLVPDHKHAQAYTLMRQEGDNLDANAYALDDTKIRAYAMVEGIRSIRIDYTVLIKKEEPKEKSAQSTTTAGASAEKTEQPETFERKTVQEWHEIEDQKPPWPLIPQFVTMHVTLWDDTFKHTTAFTFEFQIIPRFEKEEKKEKTSGFGLGTILSGNGI